MVADYLIRKYNFSVSDAGSAASMVDDVQF